MTTDNRQALNDLTRSLRHLHQALVQIVRRDHERQWGPVDSGQLLQLLTRHPDFDWLHTLSELMVDIDEMLDKDQLTSEDVRGARESLETMLAPGETVGLGFSARYLEALQQDPALIIAHMDVRRALDALKSHRTQRDAFSTQSGSDFQRQALR